MEKIQKFTAVDVEEVAKRIHAKDYTNDERNTWLCALAWKSLTDSEKAEYYKRAKNAIKKAQEALKKEWQQWLY